MKLTRRSFMGRLAALCGAGAVVPKVVKGKTRDEELREFVDLSSNYIGNRAYENQQWEVLNYTKSVKIKRPLQYPNEKVFRDMNELFEKQRKMDQQMRLAALRGVHCSNERGMV